MKKTILFDLDETLLDMNPKAFEEAYFLGLTEIITKYEKPFDVVLKVLKKAVYAMSINNGLKSNYDVFWEVFESGLNLTKAEIMDEIDDFYANRFSLLKTHTSSFEVVPLLIEILKKKGYQLVLATNPLFPFVATASRIEWANLKVEDFVLITTYENSHYCKPNPLYFKEILNKLNLKETDCLMIGNHIEEDLAALKVGIDCILINDKFDDKIDIRIKQCNLEELYQEVLSWPEVKK